MKTTHLISAFIPLTLIHHVTAATLTEYFEIDEDTSVWNSTWVDGINRPGFLDPALGGDRAGGGASLAQSFSRSFKDNLAGLSVTTAAYSMSMYVHVGAFSSPSEGNFEIVDGSYGSANAANLRIFTEEVSPGVHEYRWQARSTSGWQDLGIDLDLQTPYRVELEVDPLTFTYSATVHRVTDSGAIIESGSLSGLTFDPNVITNGQNGNLLFYVQSSSGPSTVSVDNINITSIPEPSAALLLALPAAALAIGHRRRYK